MGIPRASIPKRCLQWPVRAIDEALRRIMGVREFESASEGLLRIELGSAERELRLSDGTRVHPGDCVMELHLWNEQLLPTPAEGFGLGWAVRIRRQALSSLQRLGRHLREDPRLGTVRAIRMQPAIASRRPASILARVLQRIGFEAVADATPSRGVLFRFLENFWLLLLTWAHNPRGLRGRQFNRTRREFWISRSRFLELYGNGRLTPPSVACADQPALP